MRRALELLAGLVLEDGRRWGDAATNWQWADAHAVLDPEGSDPYSSLTRPRGGSKTTDLAGVGIAALLTQLPEGSRSYAVAADEDQAGLLLDAAAGFVARTDGLERELRMERRLVSVSLSREVPNAPSSSPCSKGFQGDAGRVHRASRKPLGAARRLRT